MSWLSHLGCPCSERLQPTHLSLNDGIAVPRGHVQLWRKCWEFEILSSRFYNKRSYALNHVFPHLWRMNFQKQYEVRQKAVYYNCSRRLFNFSSYIRWRVVHRDIQRQPQSSTCTGAYVHTCMNMNTRKHTAYACIHTCTWCQNKYIVFHHIVLELFLKILSNYWTRRLLLLAVLKMWHGAEGLWAWSTEMHGWCITKSCHRCRR